MASQLSIYNDALMMLGSPQPMRALTEDRPDRRMFDMAWTGVRAEALEQGYWNFAMKAAQADPDEGVEPSFGFTYAYQKPSDWVRTYIISGSERLDPPLLEYRDEAGYWYANCEPLWVKFVSDASDYGLDMAGWPESFSSYVATLLAMKTCLPITGSLTLLDGPSGLRREAMKALANARTKDAMNEPPMFPPTGTWANSRGSSSTRGSRWNGQWQ